VSAWGYGCAWRMQERDLYAFAGAGHPADGFTERRPGEDVLEQQRALVSSWRETIESLYLDGLGTRRTPA
jgi:hypothetical protein